MIGSFQESFRPDDIKVPEAGERLPRGSTSPRPSRERGGGVRTHVESTVATQRDVPQGRGAQDILGHSEEQA